LEGEQDLAKLEKLAAEYKLNMLGRNKFDQSLYFLSCTKESKGNALEMANLMYESGAFNFASPEFLVESKAVTNDQYFNSQWGLKNTAYPAFDINYEETISSFSFPNIGNIIVAVVDNGVYPNHPDLPLHSVSFNAHTGGYPSGLYEEHGTLVAGVIGATANNGIGIAGVASGVKIMPISIVYTDDGKRLGIPASTSTHFANAIRIAANNGARVINNSWYFDTSFPIPEINNAITYAQNKESVVVFGSGNNSGAVSQPAAGAPSATLVVGAIEQDGNRAPYSNYGSSLDVVAPGTGIWTTTWTGGYRTERGTSLAAPHVAGVAALILSKNPNLTQKQVADIIEKSANRANPLTYNYAITSGRSNGTWNSQMGYGVLNAYRALQETPTVQHTVNITVINHHMSENIDELVLWDGVSNTTICNGISSGQTYSTTVTFNMNKAISFTAYASSDTEDYDCFIDRSGEITFEYNGNGYGDSYWTSTSSFPY
jgi:subtilisin family serine protease